jgi:hypothetical protein
VHALYNGRGLLVVQLQHTFCAEDVFGTSCDEGLQPGF